MNIVLLSLNMLIPLQTEQISPVENFPPCSPKVSPCGIIYGSVLPETLDMTPPELIRTTGW